MKSHTDHQIVHWLDQMTQDIEPSLKDVYIQDLLLHLSGQISSALHLQPSSPTLSMESLSGQAALLPPGQLTALLRDATAHAHTVWHALNSFHMSDTSLISLDSWITRAIKGLSQHAKQRIETEIRAHYYDAVEKARIHNATAAQAHQEAIECLGDPIKANIRFRRCYFTEMDMNAWSRLIQGCPINRFRMILFIFTATVCAPLLLIEQHRQQGPSGITALLFYAICTGYLILGRYTQGLFLHNQFRSGLLARFAVVILTPELFTTALYFHILLGSPSFSYTESYMIPATLYLLLSFTYWATATPLYKKFARESIPMCQIQK